MEDRSWCLISKFWDKVANSALLADQRAPCARSASPSLRLQVHIWPFLWVQWLQTQVLGLLWQALCPLSPLPTPNFTVAQILPSPPKHCTGIQSPLGPCKIVTDEAASRRLSKSALKDYGRVWKEPDSCQLPAVLCGCLLASLFFCGYKKGQLINCTNVDGSVHQGCLERVIFTFRSIFSLWIMGWWDEKWSWLLVILRSLQAE